MPRKKFSSSDKVKAVLDALKDPDGIAAYSRRTGISQTLLYRWQSQMISNASSLFDKPSKATKNKIQHLESQLQRKDKIIAAVTEEAIELKKKHMD
jgi:transposase-like protein